MIKQRRQDFGRRADLAMPRRKSPAKIVDGRIADPELVAVAVQRTGESGWLDLLAVSGRRKKSR